MQAEAAVNNAAVRPSVAARGPLDSLRNALIVTRREMRDSFRDWRIMLPIFMMTLVFPALAQG
ncbi:MAG: hypothetical protein IT323_19255, partial [Anaerolineae bacterium]|nr:hypothetical protein [Anaerolineae bacterium]